MKTTIYTLITILLALVLAPLAFPQSTVLVTHADGSTHKFTITADMDQSFDAIRLARVTRDPANPQTPNIPGPVTREEHNTGELVEAILFETYERAIQQPQFQPSAMKTKLETARATLEADQKKALSDAKAAVVSSRQTNPAPAPAKPQP